VIENEKEVKKDGYPALFCTSSFRCLRQDVIIPLLHEAPRFYPRRSGATVLTTAFQRHFGNSILKARFRSLKKVFFWNSITYYCSKLVNG